MYFAEVAHITRGNVVFHPDTSLTSSMVSRVSRFALEKKNQMGFPKVYHERV